MPVEMDGARSPGTQSDEVVGVGIFRDVIARTKGFLQDTTESSTPLSSVSASTHDTSRARYHMKELGTFAKRLEEVSITSIYSSKSRKGFLG